MIVLQRFQRHFCCNWTIGPAEKFASLDRNFDDFCHFESIKLLVSNWTFGFTISTEEEIHLQHISNLTKLMTD
jgi:hypothetical protein